MKLCRKKLHSYNKLQYKQCPECCKISKRNFMKKYNQRDYVKEKARQSAKEYYSINKDKINEKRRNDINLKQKRKLNWTKYKELYAGVYRANKRKYKLLKKNRIPRWLSIEDKIKINNIYKKATILTKETGILYSVDHIVPLQGKNVSGLHVPWNLQILTQEENRKKSNKETW